MPRLQHLKYHRSNRLKARWAHPKPDIPTTPGPAYRGAQPFLPVFFRGWGCERSLLWYRDQERLGIMRRVVIDQYRTTASTAPQMSIITSRSDAVRDGTKD